MTTTVTKTIGSAGGRDYATIALWIAALPANLITADQQWIGECYNDSEFTGSTLIFTGITTDATRNIILRCATGQGIAGNANKLTNALLYNASNGVAFKATGGANSIIDVAIDFLTIDGLQLSPGGTGFEGIRQTAQGDNCVFKRLIVGSGHNSLGVGALNLNGGTAVNCLALNDAGGTICISIGNSAKFRNVTAVQTGGSPAGYGFRGNYDSPLYLNCASFGTGVAFNTGTSGSSDYNSSDDTSAPGAHSLISQTFSAQFVSTTVDFRVKAGAGLINAGTPDTANTGAVDIVGSARSATPTIGCWEFAAAAPTGPPGRGTVSR